jgi:hypothetical protein
MNALPAPERIPICKTDLYNVKPCPQRALSPMSLAKRNLKGEPRRVGPSRCGVKWGKKKPSLHTGNQALAHQPQPLSTVFCIMIFSSEEKAFIIKGVYMTSKETKAQNAKTFR